MRDKDDLDLLFDSALSTYADPGLDTGLEQRILARITAESAPAPRPRWMLWAIALPVAACLFIFLTLLRTPRPQSGRPVQPLATEPPQVVAARVIPPAVQHYAASRGHKPHASPQSPALVAPVANPGLLSKRDIFPSPRPLSPQERALVEFATQVPEPQRRAVVEAQMQDDAPLRIADLHIPPLEPPDEGKN